jgi:hypothetical protein
MSEDMGNSLAKQTVIPAKAGIQKSFSWSIWMPAFVSMTKEHLDASFRLYCADFIAKKS